MLNARFLNLAFLLILGLSGPARAIDPADLLPQEQAYPLSVRMEGADRAILAWDIAQGYYLYRSKFKFASETPGIQLGEAMFPAGEHKYDEFFGDMEIYRGHLEIALPIRREDPSVQALDLKINSQGCADAGVCFPPYKQTIRLSLAPDAAAPQASQAGNPLANLLQGAKPPGLGKDELLPPEQAFHFIAEVKDAHTLRVAWQIADGYYLYRERFQFALLDSAGAELGTPSIPRGAPVQDEQGTLEVFRKEIAFDLPLKRTAAGPVSVRLQAKYQGCAEKGVCYPPMTQIANLDLPAADLGEAPKAETQAPLAEQDRIAAALKNDSVWLTALSFLGFGLLMTFTPCVFPMIPILSGIIVGHGHKITAARALTLSLSYVLAAALTYAVFGVLAGLFGGNLQAAFQNPWVIGAFSILFVLLSLSMFGFYELQAPSFIQTRATGLSHKQKGGTLTGAAVMGALSALIVGPCMAAPLAGALIYIGQTGDAVLGGLALFSMGLGMGVPLLIVGTSAGKLLPRAGMWMNAVKSVFGVAMLAVAVWLLERILPPAVTLFLWALLLILPAIFMNALDALPPDASGWRKLWKGVGVAMLTWGVLLLIGVATGKSNPLQPLTGGVISAGACAETDDIAFRRVADVASLERALNEARAQGRWAMLDYYADWCVSCKEMERETFADSKVRATLGRLTLLQADVTANSEADTALLQRYGLVGPPAALFFGPDGAERADFRLVGFLGPEDFLAHLRRLMQG
jgi:thiol:disulfide interchange protein DsbD